MGQIHGKNVYLRLSGSVIDSDGNNATMDISVDTAEVTSYGDGYKEYLEGAAEWSMTVEFFYDGTDKHAPDVAFDMIGSGKKALSFCPEDNAKAASVRYYGSVDVTRKSAVAPVGGAVTMSLTLQGVGTLNKGTVVLIDDCEAQWAETGGNGIGTGVTNDVDATDFKRGSNSIKIEATDLHDAGDYLAMATVASRDLTSCHYVTFWAKCSETTSAADLKLHLSKTANLAGITESLDFPVLTAGVWREVNIALVDPSDCGDIDSIGIEDDVDLGEFTLRIDDIRGT